MTSNRWLPGRDGCEMVYPVCTQGGTRWRKSRFPGHSPARTCFVRAGAGLAGLALIVVGVAGPSAPSFAASQRGAPGALTMSANDATDYLALGDSVSFGYRESNTLPPPNYFDASSFVGFPEDVGAALGFRVANAACSGETSASFIAKNVQSNGCENSPGGGPGYRTFFPLHVAYSGTQLQYAVRYLSNHPATRLVSLMIGANDAFLCQETTADHCATELPAVLNQISANVAVIMRAIRHDAKYHGQVAIVNYYSLDYANPADNAASQALNTAMDDGAKPFNVKFADGYGEFQTAALHSGGHTCTAGLLTQLTTGGCGVHPERGWPSSPGVGGGESDPASVTASPSPMRRHPAAGSPVRALAGRRSG